jgi:hypothetical protein
MDVIFERESGRPARVADCQGLAVTVRLLPSTSMFQNLFDLPSAQMKVRIPLPFLPAAKGGPRLSLKGRREDLRNARLREPAALPCSAKPTPTDVIVTTERERVKVA